MKRAVTVRDVEIGRGRIKIQSMTNVKTSDASAVLGQIGALAQAGCDLVRVSVPDPASAQALKEIVPASNTEDVDCAWKNTLRQKFAPKSTPQKASST